MGRKFRGFTSDWPKASTLEKLLIAGMILVGAIALGHIVYEKYF